MAAGERLREDFELSQMNPKGQPDWEDFVNASGPKARETLTGAGSASSEARARVAHALSELGPGLGDVALRACCYLEGMESLEKRMGWSARSGKIVLRIALQRLMRHYEEAHGRFAPKIG